MKKQKAITIKDLERRVKYARHTGKDSPRYQHVHTAKDPLGRIIACATDGKRIAFARTLTASTLDAPTEAFGQISEWADKIGLGKAVSPPVLHRTTTFGRSEALAILARLAGEGEALGMDRNTDMREAINIADIRARRAKAAHLRAPSALNEAHVKAAEGALARAKKRLAKLVDYGPNVVLTLNIGLPATIRLTSSAPEAHEILPLSSTAGSNADGNVFRIGLAVEYLTALLMAMRDDIVGMRTASDRDAVIFVEEDAGVETIHMLMPVRL